MSKMKILLSTIHTNAFYTPLSLLYIRACLLKDRHLGGKVDIEIKEFNYFDDDDFILYEIQKFAPQIIGFSCYIWNIKKLLAITDKVKKIHKNTKIILGGPQVSPIAKKILKENNQADIIVRGEGEVTFLELIKSFADSHEKLNDIAGITYRLKNKIIDNSNRAVVSDLDSIPSPYLSNPMKLENRDVCFETQRGCVFKCDFCYYNKDFKKIRFFTMERVKKDLIFLLSRKLKSIFLMDPVFNVDIDRAKEICRFIIQNNKNKISFHAEIRAEFVDEELAELFHRASIKYFEIGLQSSKDKVLHNVHRALNKKRFIDGIKLLKKYDLATEIQLIFGLPGDTPSSFKKSLEFALNLDPKILTVFRLQVLPGTKIWNEARKLGIIYENEPPYNFLCSRSLSFTDTIEAQKIANSLNLFHSKTAIKYLCKEIYLKFLDIVKLWINWLNDDAYLLRPQKNYILKNKFRKFVKYICEKNNVDFSFYDALLQKELTFYTETEIRQMEKRASRQVIKTCGDSLSSKEKCVKI